MYICILVLIQLFILVTFKIVSSSLSNIYVLWCKIFLTSSHTPLAVFMNACKERKKNHKVLCSIKVVAYDLFTVHL